MSSGKAKGAAKASQEQTTEKSLLDQVLETMPSTVQSDEATGYVRNVVQQAMEGTLTYDKNIVRTIHETIKKLDETMSEQLSEVMHHPDFQKLEGSWRGLHHLVMNSETSKQLQLRMLNVSKRELATDLENAIEFDQSELFRKVYENEFGMPGGKPYSALVGDFEFTNHPEDIELLRNVSGVCASAFSPFISAASPELFGFESWEKLPDPRDIEKIFMQKKYIPWNSFRDSEDSRWVTLTMPRVLARLPYGEQTKKIESFDFEEVPLHEDGSSKQVQHDDYCWMNSSFVYGARLTAAFARTGWCTAIRGKENGGMIENLPTHIFKSPDGDDVQKCPTEVAITDRRENELSKAGFLPLCHYKDTDYSVFFGAQTANRPRVYDEDDATANAAISARLPYLMATSRIAHYLKCMARDWVGNFAEREDMEKRLNRWIKNYVDTDKNPSEEARAKRPLADAHVTVTEVPGSPGSYNAVAMLRPWLQMESLTASLRLVARMPEGIK